MSRTSTTHPLRIDSLELREGRIGLIFCLGKQGDSLFGTPWARDLALDLDAIRDWGAQTMVTLIEEHEFDLLGVRGLGEAVTARGMDWLHFPIRDVDVPDPATRALWQEMSARIHDRLQQGGRVLIHCRGGLGRAGTIAALLLTEHDETADRAIGRVRSARPGAIETRAQERWLHGC